MTKIASLALTAAGVLLTFSLAMAADDAEAEPRKSPAVVAPPSDQPQPQPQENSSPTPAQGGSPAPQEEPACDQ